MTEALITVSSKLQIAANRLFSERLSASKKSDNSDAGRDGRLSVLSYAVFVIFALLNLDSVWLLWSSTGNFLQSIWDRILLLVGDDAYILYVYGTTIWLTVLYWTVGTMYTLMDITGRPQWIRKYKVQPGTNEPVDRAKVMKTVRTVLFNQIVVGLPFAMFGFWVMEQIGTPTVHQLPTFPRLCLEVVVFVLLEEMGFYYSHRFLHHRSIYKYIHKIHHEWTAPIAIADLYCHPVEHIFGNMIPSTVGPIIMSSHVAVTWLWLAYAILTTMNYHSGYHLPGFVSPEAHDFHHHKFTECYGFFNFFDALHGTNKAFRASAHGKRHVMSFSLKPLTNLIPDDNKLRRNTDGKQENEDS